MGKLPNKKQKVEGGNIARFFDPRPLQRQAAAPQAQAQQGQEGAAGESEEQTPPPALVRAPAAAAVPVAAPAPRPLLVNKHLALAQDNFMMMSQDTDALQVVWSDSPRASQQQQLLHKAATQPQALPGNHGAGPSRPGGAHLHQLQEMKNRLVSAAQRPREAVRPTQAAHGRQHQGEVLDGLFHQRPAAAAAAATAAAAAAAAQAVGPEPSITSGAPSGLTLPSQPARTPAAGLRGILKREGAAGGLLAINGNGAGAGGRQTPGSGVRFCVNDVSGGRSTTGGWPARVGSGPGSARGQGGGWERQSGQKRKVLLELLDQVEIIIKGNAAQQQATGAAAAAQVTMAGAVAAAAGQQRQQEQRQPQQQQGACVPGLAAEKENASQQVNAVLPKPASQEAAAALDHGIGQPAPGLVSSQQLMPPPPGVARTAPAQPSQQLQQQQQQHVAHVSRASGPAAPAQPAVAAAAAAAAGRGSGEDTGAVASQAATPPPAAQPLRDLPPSPYAAEPGSGPPVKVPLAVPAAAAAAPYAAPAAAAQGPAGGADGSRSDSLIEDADSWDDGFDPALLDQMEGAALRDRAERGLNGDPSSSSAGEQQAGGMGRGAQRQAQVAQQQQEQPGGRPLYPGDREEVHYTIKAIYQKDELVLLLHNKYKAREVYAHLRPPWIDEGLYRVGDSVNLIVPQLDLYEGHLHCLLDIDSGLLVLHPDLLLSGTRITTSNKCTRRSYLQERIAEDGSSGQAAVKGTLHHQLIQAALAEQLRNPATLRARAEAIVAAQGETLLDAGLSEEEAVAYLQGEIPGLLRWMACFVRHSPGPGSTCSGHGDNQVPIERSVAVAEVLDIEESIWSPKYGVKGMIDISARLILEEPPAPKQNQQQYQQRQQQHGQSQAGWLAAAAAAQQGQAARQRRECIAPIEIKTGKPWDGEHMAQVRIYLLMMEERYGRPLDWGVLWNTQAGAPAAGTKLVGRKNAELACLLATRNRLAAALAAGQLPRITKEKRECKLCYAKLNCALAHMALEGGTAESWAMHSTDRPGQLAEEQQGLVRYAERAAGHLSPADCEFLAHWNRLLSLEEGGSASRRPEIWAMPGQQRQALGRCLAGLVLDHVDASELLYTFRSAAGGALPETGFQEGEMLLLSLEGRHAAVARCHLHAATGAAVTVLLDKPLRAGLLRPDGTQAAAARGALQPAGGAAGGAAGSGVDGSALWRLDRDDVSSSFTRLRNNVFALFRREHADAYDKQNRRWVLGAETEASQHAAKLRRLIVDLAPPQQLEGWGDFAQGGSSTAAACGAGAVAAGQQQQQQQQPTPEGMNHQQGQALRRVLGMRDYTLVLGMPGSGKTTTIVSMVAALAAQGKRVLVTSYTNSAVDNILMKLLQQGVPFLRLGRPGSVHPAVRPYLPGGERSPGTTTEALKQLASSVQVFGCTCFGVNHPLLRATMLDVCIVDEAGQITLPATLGPLLRARSFVLVGDHNQLPPLVANREAEEGGLGVSLFRRLAEAHPGSVVALPVQYRMASDIMALTNHLIYNNQLICGNPDVAQAALSMGAAGAAALAARCPNWVQQALSPERRVVFLDTAAVPLPDGSSAGDSVLNAGEAATVVALLRAACQVAGVGQERCGVISPYRSQVALIDRLCRQAGLGEVEVLTVDKCQGRDKDCILLSLVRSNAEQDAGRLLKDWRRINVAITRAKCKLILLGDSGTLASIDLFARMLELVREWGWYLPMPAGADAAVQQMAADAEG